MSLTAGNHYPLTLMEIGFVVGGEVMVDIGCTTARRRRQNEKIESTTRGKDEAEEWDFIFREWLNN